MEKKHPVLTSISFAADALFIGAVAYLGYLIYTRHCLNVLNNTFCFF